MSLVKWIATPEGLEWYKNFITSDGEFKGTQEFSVDGFRIDPAPIVGFLLEEDVYAWPLTTNDPLEYDKFPCERYRTMGFWSEAENYNFHELIWPLEFVNPPKEGDTDQRFRFSGLVYGRTLFNWWGDAPDSEPLSSLFSSICERVVRYLGADNCLLTFDVDFRFAEDYNNNIPLINVGRCGWTLEETPGGVTEEKLRLVENFIAAQEGLS